MGGGKTCTGFDFIVDVITRVHDRLQKTRELEIHGLIFAMCFLTLMQGLARNCAPMCVNKKYLQGILYYLYNNYNSKVTYRVNILWPNSPASINGWVVCYGFNR